MWRHVQVQQDPNERILFTYPRKKCPFLRLEQERACQDETDEGKDDIDQTTYKERGRERYQKRLGIGGYREGLGCKWIRHLGDNAFFISMVGQHTKVQDG